MAAGLSHLLSGNLIRFNQPGMAPMMIVLNSDMPTQICVLCCAAQSGLVST
jgi:hypothetical protein